MATCYRHPGRETNVACSNCGKPICPDCMTSTPVGMRCPDCARQKTTVKNPVGMPGRADAPATYVLVGLCVAAFFAELASGADLMGGTSNSSVVIDGGLFAVAADEMGQLIGVAEGQPYRIVTAAFLHSGIIHLALNMFALYILGRLLEPGIGTARFVAIYAVAVLAGSCGALLLDPLELTVGASGGVFGLMAAGFLIARNRGMDQLATEIGFFVIINLVFTFSVNGISVGGHIGGLIGGGLAALLISALERRRVPNRNAVEIGGLLALCAIGIIGCLVAAEAGVPAGV